MVKLFLSILSAFIVIGIVMSAFLFFGPREQEVIILSDFEECAKAGYAIMESYPRKCAVEDGRVFIENIENELEKSNLIISNQPRPNQKIKSPFVIEGEARGFWFFEGDFPIKLFDSNNELLVEGIARTDGDWMSEEFVAYRGILKFEKPKTSNGILVLEKDNPSGLLENADQLRIPIEFDLIAEYKKVLKNKCIITGCSGQICAQEEVVTTCEYRDKFSCYRGATCESQTNGECGWTLDTQLAQCLGIVL